MNLSETLFLSADSKKIYFFISKPELTQISMYEYEIEDLT